MTTYTLNAEDFAKLVSTYDCVILPVAVGGYVYCVRRGANEKDMYRVAVA